MGGEGLIFEHTLQNHHNFEDVLMALLKIFDISLSFRSANNHGNRGKGLLELTNPGLCR